MSISGFVFLGGGGEGQHGSFSSSVQYMVPSRRLGSLQVLLLPCLYVLFILFSLYVCCCATFAHPCSVLCVLTQFAMFQFVSSTMTHQKKAAVRFELEKALPSGEWWHFDFDLPEGADVHGSQWPDRLASPYVKHYKNDASGVQNVQYTSSTPVNKQK